MATNYCDYSTGNDTTGDGTYGLPYKTIDKASTGLTGGDEVRVAKSPADTALSGTLTFTINSATVSGSGTNFSGELAVGDFIKGNDGYYYEVITIGSTTSLTLYQVYGGATTAGVTSYKMGTTSTGAAAASTTVIQQMMAGGTSMASTLKVSGGWTLATQTQDGVTNFKQVNGTFANRYGYGFYGNAKTFWEIDKISFLHYNYGMYFNAGVCFNKITGAILAGNVGTGILLTQANVNVFTNVKALCNGGYGFTISNSMFNIINSPYVGSNANAGIYLSTSHNNFLYDIISRYNSGTYPYGIMLNYSVNNEIYNQVSTGHTAPIAQSGSSYNYVFGLTHTDTNACTNYTGYYNPKLFVSKLGGVANADYIYSDYLSIWKQNTTTQAGSGYAWRVNPSASNRHIGYPARFTIAKIAVAANTQVTFKVYCGKDHATNIAGKVLIRKGQIAGVTTDVESVLADTTNWQQLTLTFTPTEVGVVEVEFLGWYVAAAGNLYVDTIECSQA